MTEHKSISVEERVARINDYISSHGLFSLDSNGFIFSQILLAEEAAYDRGVNHGLLEKDLMVYGQAIELNGKRIAPEDFYKSPKDYFQEGFEKAKNMAALALDELDPELWPDRDILVEKIRAIEIIEEQK